MALEYNTLTLIYIGIGVFAYFTILFLTYRDMRIFKRTGYASYRKGAFKGILASSLVLVGIFLMPTMQGLLGLALVFVGLMVNQKGKREKVFTTAGTLARFIGKTDIVRTPEEIREDYEKEQAEKKRTEKEKERSERNEKRREKRGKEEEGEEP